MFRLMEKARNRNNKGFSLVELIVVVLIIAIIAVALAPQVVKYVNKARINVKDNNEATIKSAVQAAVAEYQGQENYNAASLTPCAFYVSSANSAVSGYTPADSNNKPSTADESNGNKALSSLIHDNLGSDKLDQNYDVTIAGDGTVTVTADGSDTSAPSVPAN